MISTLPFILFVFDRQKVQFMGVLGEDHPIAILNRSVILKVRTLQHGITKECVYSDEM